MKIQYKTETKLKHHEKEIMQMGNKNKGKMKI